MDVGLGLRIKPLILQHPNHVPRDVILALAERNHNVVLDDVVQTVRTKPAKGLVLALRRDRSVDLELRRHRQAIHVQTVNPHLSHEHRDRLRREPVLLLLEVLELLFLVLDLTLHVPQISDQGTQVPASVSVDVLQRGSVVEEVLEQLIHTSFSSSGLRLTSALAIRIVDPNGGM